MDYQTELSLEDAPYPVIPKIKGALTRELIQEVEKMIQANAASFPSELGGGAHGYLGLTMDNTEYLAATRHNFVLHTNPGINPTIPVTGATGLVISALE